MDLSSMTRQTIFQYKSSGGHLADPNKLWPSGVVQYRFYRTFPRCVDLFFFSYDSNFLPRNLQTLVRQAMDYITSSVPCITFEHDRKGNSVNFVLISTGQDTASEIGMRGGKQVLLFNPRSFDNGILRPVHELLHTLGFIHEQSRTLVLTAH